MGVPVIATPLPLGEFQFCGLCFLFSVFSLLLSPLACCCFLFCGSGGGGVECSLSAVACAVRGAEVCGAVVGVV